ncbi:MAG: HEPN domain-containing protein [Methanomassiliicoccales archaeon]|nr:HEPN domain-containing protein [Methanomassiliicoccales archaeon]
MQILEFLDLSEYLLKGSSGFDEASYRTAADRAYLASSLLLANILWERYGIDIPRSTRFYHVIEERAADLDPHLSENLNVLRRIRNNADYDLEIAFRKSDAVRAIVFAKIMTTWMKGKYQ